MCLPFNIHIVIRQMSEFKGQSSFVGPDFTYDYSLDQMQVCSLDHGYHLNYLLMSY